MQEKHCTGFLVYLPGFLYYRWELTVELGGSSPPCIITLHRSANGLGLNGRCSVGTTNGVSGILKESLISKSYHFH